MAHFSVHAIFAMSAVSSTAWAVDVPAFSSDPSAPYTLYIDLGGFSYTGTWGGSTPGTTPAYDIDGNASSFSAAELTNIHNIWSRIAQKYAPFNINVTTVDPAIAAGQASSDSARQTYYDATAKVMHTVVGGSGSWIGGGGISYVDTTPYASPNTGYHTNWVFSAQSPSNLQFVAEAAAHENGHGLGLDHQSDFNGSSQVNSYSSGANGVAPIMGVSYYASRGGLWSRGTYEGGSGALQNDPQIIANDPGMGGFREDHVGHSLAAATHLPTSGNTIDYTTAKGVIVPASLSNPNPLGVSNYTSDHWSFVTLGGSTTLTVNSGITTFGSSAADQSPTLDSTLALYKSDGTLVQMLDTTSLTESLTTNLPAGLYDLAVFSHGGLSDTTYTQRDFYDMGSYYLSGSIRQPLAGDANLDGKVDVIDLGILATHWQQAGNFTLGDFNFDGLVNVVDLGLLSTDWQQTAGGLSFAAALASFDLSNVPEPGLATLTLATLLLRTRRNRV